MAALETSQVNKAVAILRAGGLVGLPTETVYGLAADASQREAVGRIFAAKGRPVTHPLIVHLGSLCRLSEWARDIPPFARQLAEAFWPGPLTLVLKKQPSVLTEVTGGQLTIGIRIPAHPLALAVLEAFGGGLAAPSANRFGRISPTTAAAVREELGAAVDIVLDGGACEQGIESTIVDCSGEMPVLLRPGALSVTALADVLKQPVLSAAGRSIPRVSGSLPAHYAPQTPLQLVSADQLLQAQPDEGSSVAALVYSSQVFPVIPNRQYFRLPGHFAGYAQGLYACLRSIDNQGFDGIEVETVPDTAEWAAIADRLRRAAF